MVFAPGSAGVLAAEYSACVCRSFWAASVDLTVLALRVVMASREVVWPGTVDNITRGALIVYAIAVPCPSPSRGKPARADSVRVTASHGQQGEPERAAGSLHTRAGSCVTRPVSSSAGVSDQAARVCAQCAFQRASFSLPGCVNRVRRESGIGIFNAGCDASGATNHLP